MDIRNLYVHVPFCRSRCDYCAFYSTIDNDKQNAWLQAIRRHLNAYQDRFAISALDTLYIGGGSPSCLEEGVLDQICSMLSSYTHVNTEWTIEINPADCSESLLSNLTKYPINRISVGIETFNDLTRSSIHRRGSKPEVISVLDRFSRLNDISISFDLMYGLPHQNLRTAQDDLRLALQYKPAHISYYELILEPGTPLYSRMPKRICPETDVEENDRIWELIRATLETSGYGRYEVSNWSLPGHESRHNLNYWRLGSWLGLGPGAVSNIRTAKGFERWTNSTNLQTYIEDFSQAELEHVEGDNALVDYVMMNLRKKEGIPLQDFSSLFPMVVDTVLNFLEGMFPRYFMRDREYFRINDSGLDQLNPVIIKLMDYMESAAYA